MFKVVATSPLILPDDAALRRDHPVGFPDVSGLLARYDYHTLFYDLFQTAERIELIGPPLFNLAAAVQGADVRLNFRPLRTGPVLRDCNRTQDSHIPHQGTAFHLSLHTQQFRLATWIGRDHRLAFAGKRVVFTMSRNNDLSWIEDWSRFYATVHGANAILIYDNASTAYDADAVLRTLQEVPGLDVAIVVRWPFLYGPRGEQGVGVRGDFSQRSMYVHAMRRFLAYAEGVLNVDIDELVVPRKRTIFEALRATPEGALHIPGHWIEGSARRSGEPPRFTDSAIVDIRRPPCRPKWALVPAFLSDTAYLEPHRVLDPARHLRQVEARDQDLCHFSAINTGWRDESRSQPLKIPKAFRRTDRKLRRLMRQVFAAPKA